MNRTNERVSRPLMKLAMWLLVMTVLLSACGGTAGTNPQPEGQKDTAAASDEQSKPATRKIQTVNGEIEIPAEPKRIVAQGYLATFLALGVKPVGAPFWDIDSPHIKSQTAGIEDIGTIDAGSVEKILSLNPDLIVTLSDDPKLYEQLSKIAPTIVFVHTTFKDSRDQIRTFGEILGKEKEAEAWIASFNDTVAKAKQRIKGVVDENATVAIMGGFEKQLVVYGQGLWRGAEAMYRHLGLKRPPQVQKFVDEGKENMTISLEQVKEFSGDYLFVESGKQAGLDPESPIWNTLDVVKKGHVYQMDTDYFWPYDPIAVQAQINLIADMLVEGKHKL
ncbi:ABC transporter substrate-binding protein [Brevibacillus parabrevis]|uniref:ABC transporter substrate-binding protein n=1 Tax=Brevibacillus parabrevis TaxID=54914 RepID=UPI001C2419EB|nr:ABC transporter substrate-binding protein [Brevibacillus parabrevis]MBU8711756.1 ABC transporter substrate-binding protein [Brevibacillus parabrevis]